MDHPKLSTIARAAVSDEANDIFVSVVSIYELGFKAWLGKLPYFLSEDLERFVAEAGYHWLSPGREEMRRAARLDWPERDPWDRIIIAQGLVQQCVVVSADKAFDDYPIDVLW